MKVNLVSVLVSSNFLRRLQSSTGPKDNRDSLFNLYSASVGNSYLI